MTWSIAGQMSARQEEQNTTVREETCGINPNDPKYYLSFGAPGSTGNTSGDIVTGAYRETRPPFLDQKPLVGEWLVNTKPVLSAGGLVDGEPTAGYYIVKRPSTVVKVDDPIAINPAIDNLKRVYEGDIVFVSGNKWSVAPQYRDPLPDRTFTWEPNESPVLKAGGLVDGKLAKVGTIMLPDADYYISKQSDAFDGMRYFYEGQGVMFDGQAWSKKLQDPFVYEKNSSTNEFRNLEMHYYSPQRYERLMEQTHEDKGRVIGYQPISYETPIAFTVTPPPPEPGQEPGQPYTIDFYFYWMSPQLGIADNALPAAPIRFDFKDAWSTYHIANFEWLKERPKVGGALIGAGIILKNKPEAGQEEEVLYLYIDAFEDGNVTKIKEKGKDADGNELLNEFSISTTLTVSQS